VKFSYLQDWGTFTNETFVVVGMTQKEILADMRRRKFKKDAIEAFSRQNKPNGDETAFVWVRKGMTLLWLNGWRIDLEHYSTVVHETNHLIWEITRDKGMVEEAEMQAYQQEYLFLAIVTRLNKSLVKSKRSKRNDARKNGNS